jgi:hypothetical protein
MARYLEILGDMISTHASGSAPRRPWHWEDFGEGKFKLPSGAEIRRFLLPPGNKDCGTVASESLKSGFRLAGYDDLDERENRNLKLIHQMHWSWCRRADEK